QIKRFMSEKYPDIPCWYTVQQERLGPAHAVALAAPRIEAGDDVLVVFNDTIFVTDLSRIPELSDDSDGLIYSKEVEDYQRFGVNVVEDGFIVDMVE
nr:nucleotidyltransferase [Desulfuromonadales bacterium]